MLLRGMFFKCITLFVQSLTLLALPFIAKDLGTAQYSIWSLSYGFIQLMVPYMILQLDGAYTRFVSGEENVEKTRDYFMSLLLTVLLISGVVYVLMGYFSKPIAYFLFKDFKYENIIPILALWVGTKATMTFVRNYFRTRSQFHFDTLLSIFQQAALLVGIGYVIWVSKTLLSLFYIIIGMDLILTLLSLSVILPSFKSFGFKFNIPRKFWTYSLPLIPVMTLSWAVDYSDQLFNVHFLGHEQNGRYAVYYLYARLPHWIIITPWHYAFFPFISRFQYEGSDRQKIHEHVRKSMNAAMLAISFCIGGLILFGAELIETLGGQYISWNSIVLIYLIGMSVYFSAFYQISYHIISMQQRTSKVVYIFLGAGGIAIVLNLFFIPQFGIVGAALATLISFAITAYLTLRSCQLKLAELMRLKTFSSMLIAISFLAFYKTLTIHFGLYSIIFGLIVFYTWLLYYVRRHHFGLVDYFQKKIFNGKGFIPPPST